MFQSEPYTLNLASPHDPYNILLYSTDMVKGKRVHLHVFWFKHIYFVLQLYKHTNIYDDNTSYGIRTEAKSL